MDKDTPELLNMAYEEIASMQAEIDRMKLLLKKSMDGKLVGKEYADALYLAYEDKQEKE